MRAVRTLPTSIKEKRHKGSKFSQAEVWPQKRLLSWLRNKHWQRYGAKTPIGAARRPKHKHAAEEKHATKVRPH
eukprot:1160907-Pelagomonas_calceolata.AAC.1